MGDLLGFGKCWALKMDTEQRLYCPPPHPPATLPAPRQRCQTRRQQSFAGRKSLYCRGRKSLYCRAATQGDRKQNSQIYLPDGKVRWIFKDWAPGP